MDIGILGLGKVGLNIALNLKDHGFHVMGQDLSKEARESAENKDLTVYFKDSVLNYERAKNQGIHFLDCGTSGGMEGARNGACLMIGGEKKYSISVSQFSKHLPAKKGTCTPVNQEVDTI